MLTSGRKLEELRRGVRERGRAEGGLVVAFSGGVDSGLLLTVAHEVLGEVGARVLGVTLESELLPKRELEQARSFLERTGVRHRRVQFAWQENEDFVRNPRERCYFCKKQFSRVLKAVAAEEGLKTVAEGVTASDLVQDRPGIAAAEEEGVWHPLAEVGLTKVEVRQAAKELGLPFWDKPASPCLATRIEHGERVTVERLARVEAAENFLKDLGFGWHSGGQGRHGEGQVRVRLHRGGVARLEVEREEFEAFLDGKKLEEICGRLKGLGFNFVTLDLEGYRNEIKGALGGKV